MIAKREVKFRAWDIAIKQMFVPSMINIHGDVRHNGIAKENTNWRRKGEEFETWLLNDGESFVLMQFTGVLDSKGKEIYEGDIIQTVSNKEYYREVIFSNGNYYLINPDRVIDVAIQALTSSHTDSVVVGNIFENPELLNIK